MTVRQYPTWRVSINVANSDSVQTVTFEIDAPDELSAEADATAMLYYGDGWEILNVVFVEEVVGTVT